MNQKTKMVTIVLEQEYFICVVATALMLHD